MYSNPRGDLALVVNHREAGESYNTALGRTVQLITEENMNTSGIFRDPLPPYSALAQWQLDLNLRRAGHCGQHSLRGASASYLSSLCSAAYDDYLRSVEGMRRLQEEAMGGVSDMGLDEKPWSQALSFAVLDLLFAHIPRSSTVLHFGTSSMLPLLRGSWSVHQDVTERKAYDFAAFSINSMNMNFLQSSSVMVHASYLLVSGDCDSAPTDLCIQSCDSPGPEDLGTFDFSLIETVCDEKVEGLGLLMYRNTRDLPKDW